jgi:gas vesicle protein
LGDGDRLAAFVLGGISGAFVALLLAPRSGRETRQLVGEQLRSGERKARRRLEQGVEAFERGRDEAEATVSAASVDVGEPASDVRPL